MRAIIKKLTIAEFVYSENGRPIFGKWAVTVGGSRQIFSTKAQAKAFLKSL